MMRLSWFILLISLQFLNNVLADQIFTAQAGGTFGRSSHEPKYSIEFHQADSPYHPNDDQESLVMSNVEGRKYICFLPSVEKPKADNSVAQNNSSNSLVESERQVRLKTPDELLEDLKGPCFYRQEGWWSYEFCYHKKLRQIHVEGEKALQEFVLGEYDAEATAAYNQNLSDFSTLKDPRSKDASQRYHTHIYTNGTICDLTNQPRETEVRFVCQPGPKGVITSIAELSTCKYALTFQTPYLCKHPMFKQERPIRHTIYCNELPKVVGNEDQISRTEREDSISSGPASSKDHKKIKTVEGMATKLSNYNEDVDSEQVAAT
ncbi:hypothetical protein MKW94_017323 [Papaver nudicaule]|uniref:Protein OS-9 homolog n=1 Tax=Papaver nudicaule TaxID=74823 RepID=A0AA41S5J7_PAPNU|nr:hypothetical protein [Papaver nudicaule]